MAAVVCCVCTPWSNVRGRPQKNDTEGVTVIYDTSPQLTSEWEIMMIEKGDGKYM